MNATFKITVKNGMNLISFEVKTTEKTSVNFIEYLSNMVVFELANLNDANVRLKSLGYKGNFFSFTTGRKCILSIETTTNDENFQFVKNIEFSFNKLAKLTSPTEGLTIVLETASNSFKSGLLIEKNK